MNHRIGTVDLPARIGLPRYFSELSALELSATHAAPLKPSAVTRWKAEAPARSLALTAPGVATHRKAPPNAKGWVADAGAGEFRDTPAVRAALQDFAASCLALSPWAVVFPSPSLFSPSAGNRERLTQFFAEVAPAELFGDAQRVWIPDGLWEPLAAVRFAQQLGVSCAVDPLVTIPGTPADLHLHYDAKNLYFRVHGIGRTRGLREEDLLSLEELSSYYPDASFIFASMERWKDAKNVAQRLREQITAVDPLAGARRRPGEELAFQRPGASMAMGPAGVFAAAGDDDDDELAVTHDLADDELDEDLLDDDDDADDDDADDDDDDADDDDDDADDAK